eukprot:snap_masked-scaffold_2-processed-gene-19.3-mRNA-1 protein AED:1.00 eAED:1.00 QI:0/0/0/0/1/1/5/0/69
MKIYFVILVYVLSDQDIIYTRAILELASRLYGNFHKLQTPDPWQGNKATTTNNPCLLIIRINRSFIGYN